ncbi:MAG: hypothetical protein LW624_01040 [Terrimonas sp.]|nr:hypothetical protein [Terrimonas sp.]
MRSPTPSTSTPTRLFGEIMAAAKSVVCEKETCCGPPSRYGFPDGLDTSWANGNWGNKASKVARAAKCRFLTSSWAI